PVPQTRMRGPVTFRQQHLDGLAEHLGAVVSEKPFHLGVDHRDHTVLVDHDHAIRRSLDGQPELGGAFLDGAFGFSARLLRLLPSTNVASDPGGADYPARGWVLDW